MAQTSLLSSTARDLLTSLAFAPTSSPNLLATSSIDGQVRVHARGSDTGAWTEICVFTAHEGGPVLKVVWAPMEWGAVLATAGCEGAVRIWEETEDSAMGILPSGQKRYAQRAVLLDARGTIRDIGFAPADLGLRIAAIASDSHLRLYDCPSPSSNNGSGLSTWSLLEDIDVNTIPLVAGASSSARTPSGVIRGFDMPASSAASLASGSARSEDPSQLEADGGWALCWCSDTFNGQLLAVSAGTSSAVRILQMNPPNHWHQVLVLQAVPHNVKEKKPSSSPAPVCSVAWAPSSGRSYHLVATGSRDGKVHVWKLRPPAPESSDVMSEGEWTSELAAEIDDHVSGGGISKVEWNITGTVLSTAGDDGKARLWKAAFSGNEWKCVSTISCEDADEEEEDDDSE
ncbi:uncharacterized protein L969DRAFT_83794 [Mixia osmundae IAM 14324]|uniref:Anaphase-promoting complex subunit 4 WD40 domain-containing protein n=1 Tax=Mixia osmundae (strain CBS 9802 / IAM 14324 / JCM 22182 / KY 12970) TaxID=764103 RepID=G7E3T2_MIXOS|nr:uncharacterized protein L969DRAFT_83794 [Mixia osmundae IAM 14324]KEI41937.1 hypothetical protein L969DRAFT_83794 [Mixia osmundae IAM 14324]GAA97492.1 hypothetical protein E5Q_04170 [Mixia osmundae IAM 14324]